MKTFGTTVHPFKQEIDSSYLGSSERTSFARTRGTLQRPENGNALITESDRGKALGIIQDGKTGREFVNPRRAS